MLASAPVLTAQLGINGVEVVMKKGDYSIVWGMDLAARGTAGQLLKALSKAPPLEIIRLVNREVYERIRQGLAMSKSSLEYSQAVLNVLGHKPELNPVMNALVDAFDRRKFAGTFKAANQGVELDTLLNASSKGPNDDDDKVGARQATTRARGGGKAEENPNNYCWLFQNGRCHYAARCRFRHVCSSCSSSNHGLQSCPEQMGSTPGGNADLIGNTTGGNGQPGQERRRPPNPRRRSDVTGESPTRPPAPRVRRARAGN